MPPRKYFSTREGLAGALKLSTARELFMAVYRNFQERGYFQQAFGAVCSSGSYTPGSLGKEISREIFIRVRKRNIWPVSEYWHHYSEDDLFDVVEFLYDNVAKPVPGAIHSVTCTRHWLVFDTLAGQHEFRTEINDVLRDYSAGFELSDEGFILRLPAPGMDALEEAKFPAFDPVNVDERVRSAILTFRRRTANDDDQREAVRLLADVLEFLRPKARKVLARQDEADLFNIANNFGIRHHNTGQKTNYDRDVWLPWIFYYYLATIHAALQLITRRSAESAG